jgi:hypothetical protein
MTTRNTHAANTSGFTAEQNLELAMKRSDRDALRLRTERKADITRLLQVLAMSVEKTDDGVAKVGEQNIQLNSIRRELIDLVARINEIQVSEVLEFLI